MHARVLEARELKSRMEHMLSPEHYHNDGLINNGLETTRRQIETALPQLRQARDVLVQIQSPEAIELAGLITALEVLRQRNAPLPEQVR